MIDFRDDFWFDYYGFGTKKIDHKIGLDFGYISNDDYSRINFFSLVFSGLCDIFKNQFHFKKAINFINKPIEKLIISDFYDEKIGEKTIDIFFRKASLFEVFSPAFSYGKNRYFFLSDFVKNHFSKLHKIDGDVNKNALKPFVSWLAHFYALMVKSETPATRYFSVFEWYEKSDDEVALEVERSGLMPLFLAFQKGKIFDQYRIDDDYNHVFCILKKENARLDKLVVDQRYEFKEDVYGMPIFKFLECEK